MANGNVMDPGQLKRRLQILFREILDEAIDNEDDEMIDDDLKEAAKHIRNWRRP